MNFIVSMFKFAASGESLILLEIWHHSSRFIDSSIVFRATAKRSRTHPFYTNSFCVSFRSFFWVFLFPFFLNAVETKNI